MADLINPKEVTLTDGEGRERTFLLSKFPAVQGREIIAKYPTSMVPKIGDYSVSEETMLKLMSYVSVIAPSGPPIPLKTRVLVDNHVGDWETLMKIEMAMMEYNCSFFRNGTLSDFFASVVQKFLAKISETLTQSSAQSSPTEKQPSTNSEPSIP